MSDALFVAPPALGRRPPDTEIVNCEQCNVECVSRIGMLQHSRREAFLSGEILHVLCQNCAKAPIKKALRENGVSLEGAECDMDSGKDYMRSLHLENIEEN